MTWREFQLKLYGFRRQQKEKWKRTRSIAHMIYLSIPEKGRKMNMEQWWPLEAKSKKISNRQKELLIDAYHQALEEAKKMK